MWRRSAVSNAESPSLVPRHAYDLCKEPDSPASPSLSYSHRQATQPDGPVAVAPLPAVRVQGRLTRAVETTPQPKRRDAPTTQSCFPRASRMARAKNPSREANGDAYEIVVSRFKEIRSMQLERAPKDSQALRPHRTSVASGGKGPGMRTVARDQCRMNHISSIKAKDVDTHNTEPAFLLGGFTAPMLWDRLAESSLKANAVNSSVMGRRKTQGAANQTTRISCKSIGQAAAAQVVATALAMAECRRRLRAKGVFVVNHLACNAVSPCALALADTAAIDDGVPFGITSTSRLVYNATPAKVTAVSVLSAATDLARSEVDAYAISNAMCTHNYKLTEICRSILGQAPLDEVWCSWVLVVYLCSHPRGRDLLRTSGLTDVDVQSAVAFERYGGEEIRRRARQRLDAEKRQKGDRGEANKAGGADGEDSKTKRKRNARTGVAYSGSDAHALVEFWHQALQSEDVSVLHTLAAHTKRTARDAALCTLERQAEGSDVACNTLLRQVSLKNAVKSAQALVSFVGRRTSDIPGVILMRARRDYDGDYRTACGFQRIDKEGASTAIHACVLATRAVRPSPETGIAIAWSRAVQKFLPRTESTATIPSVFERCYEITRDAQLGGAKAERSVATNQSFVQGETDVAMPTDAAGTTRSFISLQACMCMNATHEAVAEKMEREVEDLRARTASMPLPNIERFPMLMGISKKSSSRSEPICTPASALAVGICTNEALRRWMADKTRKNNPCLKHLGFSDEKELARDVPGIMSSEPLPLLTITDFEVERVETPRRGGTDALKDAKVAIALHVCGDGAVRIPEAIAALRNAMGATSPIDYVVQARAALLVSASQASFIGNVGPSLTAGYANASIASSKKISVADVNKLLLLSAMDCYVAGLNNIQRSFDGSSYSGTYGCRIDTGFTPPGLYAHNLRSDKRQHGNCHLSVSAADELAVAFAKSHWTVFAKPDSGRKRALDAAAGDQKRAKYYSATPPATRGIPHNLIPQIHSALNPYCDFVETTRRISGREHADTVDSIMCLPFSAWTQALRPDVEPTADASLRTCFRDELETGVATGRAYLVDATPEAHAIVREPLFRRPGQVSSGDCPFGTAYEEVDTFFNVCNALALIAEAIAAPTHRTPHECVAHLRRVVDSFVMDDARRDAPGDGAWAADALLLINCLYPSKLVVGEYALLPAIAKAVPAVQQDLHCGSPAARHRLSQLALPPDEVAEAQAFWSSFCRRDAERCAWSSGLAPLLTLLLTHKGSHKIDVEVIARVRRGLEAAVQAAWLVHSHDGTARPPDGSPAADAQSPKHLARHHIDPVFVGNDERGVLQRGALIGLKPFSYRQVLAEMLGAHLPGVVCNVAQNSGGMALRVSSDPTILDLGGRPRTDKSVSPTQTEGDEAAYGSRQDKINGAEMQKLAWDHNAILGKPLWTSIEPPHSAEIRSRGEFGFSEFFRMEEKVGANDQQLPCQSYVAAKHAVFDAATPVVAKLVNACLER